MKYTKERQKEHMSQIRRILVIKPESTILEVRDTLARQIKPLKLDKDYINRIINKIRKERANRLDHYTINVVLAKFQDEMEELKRRLWIIITKGESTEKDKIAAIRELRNSSKELFDKMFDAGIFERKLGEIGIEDKSKTLTNLLKDAEPKTKEEFIRAWRGIQGLSNRGGNIPKPSADIDRKGDIPAISKGTKE